MSFSSKAVDYLKKKRAGMFAIVQTVSRSAEADMRMNFPWKARTQTAHRALHSGVEKGQDESIVMYLAHGVKYGRFLEDGTPPHTIRAKKKVLAVPVKGWEGKVNPYGSKQLPMLSKNGQFVILGKKVNHPGTKPYPIVKPTAEKNKAILRDAMLRWWGAKK